MSDVVIYSKDWCPYCDRAKELLERKGATFELIDITADRAHEDEMIERTGRYTVPQIFIGNTHVGGSDDLYALDRSGELDALLAAAGAAPGNGDAEAAATGETASLEAGFLERLHDVIIIGSGPAGLTAAIYAARADLKPLCIEGAQAGGQLTITTDVDNYPGFPEGIMGPELMDQFRKQAERFNARLQQVDVTEVDFTSTPFRISVGADDYTADAVVVATGASATWLGIPGEQTLTGKGVSACATCDGFFFRNQELVVVGGGDTAMEEALFLTKFASKVTIVHRRDEFRASRIMATRALANEKVDVIWNSIVTEIHGENAVEAVTLEDTETGETTRFKTDGVFVAIGHKPNTDVFVDELELDDNGYIEVTEPGTTRTSVDGVFAAGDVADHIYRQAVTAAGTGCMAAIDAERWLGAR